MSRFFACILPLFLIAPALAGSADAEALGEREIEALGRANGHALACRYFEASRTAKALMTRFAPKTRRYGALFESSTNAAFAAQVADTGGCPSELALGMQLTKLAAALEPIFEATEAPSTTGPNPEREPEPGS
jgi:hypothetical protein